MLDVAGEGPAVIGPIAELRRPTLRMLLAPVRSATTAFLHVMAQSPDVDTASWLMKSALRNGGPVNHQIYDARSTYPFLFYKASFGHRTIPECGYEPFRSDADITAVRPLFMLRDPVQTLNSWRRAGWIGADLQRFRLAYRQVLDLWTRSQDVDDAARCVAYEDVARHAEVVFPQLLAHWGIPYTSGLLRWEQMPGASTHKFDALPALRTKMAEHSSRGVHASLLAGPPTFSLVVSPLELSQSEVAWVEAEFREPYESLAEAGRRFFPAGTNSTDRSARHRAAGEGSRRR